ncbi:hypothetical protein E2C01_060191 [Portunus trituberculatus]|uniref:Uncharacterized protein n=1 Tax=Portunus trituberculatus TaxID=210409 RepID=A0A5B7HAP4_PORTR|nr:hypothetical protein [Portunus trituberculatus]
MSPAVSPYSSFSSVSPFLLLPPPPPPSPSPSPSLSPSPLASISVPPPLLLFSSFFVVAKAAPRLESRTSPPLPPAPPKKKRREPLRVSSTVLITVLPWRRSCLATPILAGMRRGIALHHLTPTQC